MKYFPILLAAAWIMIGACKTKTTTPIETSAIDLTMMNTMWHTIDSLESKGLTTSALEKVREIKRAALKNQSADHLIKAVLHENRYLLQLEEDSDIKALTRAEEEVVTYPEPAKSVMHSLMAQWYASYLQSHLWELRNRVEFQGEPGADMRTWGIRHFLNKIESHYALSVEWKGLETAAVQDFQVLLTEGHETDHLRPTLYDILMHRALDYFSGSEAYLTKSPFDFVLMDPIAFSPAESFVAHQFEATDSTSFVWQTLQWYQDLLTIRLNDSAHASALLDADLKRLRFVYDHIIADDKNALYRDALDLLKEKFADNPESSLIGYYQAQLYVTHAGQWPQSGVEEDRYGYNKAMEICKSVIETYPDAYGSQLCASLILQIESQSVSATMESIVLPDEEQLLKLDYRNISEVHLKLVKLPESHRRWNQNVRESEKLLQTLNKMPAEKVWKVSFDSGNDYQPHGTEVAVPALGNGYYVLVVSDNDQFSYHKSTTGLVMFTVTKLAYWYLDDRATEKKMVVMDRQTGQPMSDVRVEIFSYEYNSALRQQEEIKQGEVKTDKQGWVDIPVYTNRSISFRLSKGDDELYTDDAYYSNRRQVTTTTRSTTLFFADRAIYRPGQKIFFKGYTLHFDPDRMPSIASNRNVEVTLYDANGQEVTKSSFTSNSYGTFSGHFDLPTGGLTGRMSISSSHGSNRLYFQVEEYKRPRFEVTFDTLKEVVSLGETVSLTGRAMNYSGNPVTGAMVGYRVERVEYIPWWYRYSGRFWPGQQERQVVVTGKTVSGDDGSIDIAFPALPKPGGDQHMMYRFEVTLAVTDITGERHEASKNISLNHQGYEVMIGLDNKIKMDDLRHIEVEAVNADGAGIDVSGQVKISKLESPSQNKRERLWEVPDIISIDSEMFKKNFPNYLPAAQEDIASWPVVSVNGTYPVSVSSKSSLDMSSFIASPGHYKIEWSWKNKAGKTLEITQYCMVYDLDKKLPGQEVLQVWYDDRNYQPAEGASFVNTTGLDNPPTVIQLVERRLSPLSVRAYNFSETKQAALAIEEKDRGGLYVHHLTVFNNRFYEHQNLVRVPWSNKALNVKLTTYRDKMEPGDQETWTITVEGEKKDKVEAEMVLSMYDASLDAFVPHEWHMSLYPSTLSTLQVYSTAPGSSNYRGLSYHWQQNYRDVPARRYRDINAYGYYPGGGYYPRVRGGEVYKNMDGEVMMEAMDGRPSAVPATEEDSGTSLKKDAIDGVQANTPEQPAVAPSVRTALDETVFFFPQLKTNQEGQLTFEFKMKEGLTRWKFQALGHTKALAYGLTQAEVVTQKQLMVFPNPPRFFRERDTISFQAKVSSLVEAPLNGEVSLSILDAFTNEDVSEKWGVQHKSQSLQLAAKGSSPVSWELHVPDGWVRPVKYQVIATAGDFSDGEESMLPVVTNRILVTETLPLPMKANEERTFVFSSMLKNTSSTSTNHLLAVEMTTSPAWYAVQALPYLMEYPHSCAEQIFSRLYANSLAKHIVDQKPSIKQMYETWRLTESDELSSNLEKNEELKSALLEETPWVRDAMSESQQKKDIALLFDENRMQLEGKEAVNQLRQMQLSNGGFPWFPGGRDNWYITQYIVEGFGHLSKLGVHIPEADRNDIVPNAMGYLDDRMVEWYKDLKEKEAKGKIKMEDHHIGGMQVHYLYASSFFPEFKHRKELDEITEYLKLQMEKYWLKHGMYDQGLMVLVNHRMWPGSTLSSDILASLRERTILHEELGRYWKMNAGFRWNEAPIEFQSLMIEVYQEMNVGQAETDELRVWLLKNKQTTRWKTTKATASAIYALLSHPDSWLESVGVVTVSLGGKQVIDDDTQGEAGSGYVKRTWHGTDFDQSWSTINVSNPNNHIAWGSVYWQYWEDLDKVKSGQEDNPLQVTRELLKVQETNTGEVTGPANYNQLKVGDKIIVRLVIETDRAMEFVHLKDLRASGFEPTDVLSGYRWGSGLGYYQSTRDLATHFFIDYLPRGKYVVEYPVTVAQAGAYSDGLATLQCMYAPEFSGHTEGNRVAATW